MYTISDRCKLFVDPYPGRPQTPVLGRIQGTKQDNGISVFIVNTIK